MNMKTPQVQGFPAIGDLLDISVADNKLLLYIESGANLDNYVILPITNSNGDAREFVFVLK